MQTSAALAFFLPGQTIHSLTSLGEGNINHTWLVIPEQCEPAVLQRLHPGVFPRPELVLANMRLVTRHLAQAVDPPITFRLLTNPNGADCFIDAAGCCWRLLSHIGPTRTLAPPLSAAQVQAIGSLLGRFHRLVANLDPNTLADPLPDFHITPRYLQQFDALGLPRSPNELEQFCLAAIESHRAGAGSLEAARRGLRHQVIHADPKSSNFLFAEDHDQAIALIDLDTVKPGLLLHDLGDCLRSCCNLAGEEGDKRECEIFSLDLFQALLKGYRDTAGDLLGPADRALLVESARLISFELGLRFFTDHLDGDRYFKTSRPGQNLHRAAVQFRLHASIQRQRNELEGHVKRLLV